ncbi:hypothetical protein MMC29_006432 [Sticta canariensis]|nr:hypothetical protein [Sticta canariensis]
MTNPGNNREITTFSCSGHMKDPIYQYHESSDMIIELGEKYHVWLNPILFYPRGKVNPPMSTQIVETPTDNENRDPSLVPSRAVTSSKPSFLTILNTMLHMFHLHGNSAPEIGCSLAGVGCVFTAVFIQGVVGVSTLHTPWPMEQKMQVKQRINERMHMFHFVLEMINKGKTTEEIEGLCLHNGYSILEFSGMEKTKKQLEGASVGVYRTELVFLRDLKIFSS